MGRKPTSEKAGSDRGLKEALILVGEDILQNQGLTALTLRAAARAAGVSHMAPYRHFDDKDALLAAIAERGFNSLAKTMSEAAGNGRFPEQDLLAIGVAYVVFAYEQPALYSLMFSAGFQDPSRFSDLAKAGEAAFLICANAVAACNPIGNASETDMTAPEAIATWALVHGLANLMNDGRILLPDNDPASIKGTIETILKSI